MTKPKTKSVSRKPAKLPKHDAEIAALENAHSIIELKSIVMNFDRGTSVALVQAINDNVARITG